MKNFTKLAEDHLNKAKLTGDGANKLQGDKVFALLNAGKTAISESMILATEFEYKEDKMTAIQMRMSQCRKHVNGQHDECPPGSKCLENNPFLLKDQYRFGENERSKVNKIVFDELLCNEKYIESHFLTVGSTSANENLHGQIYARGLISKKHHKNTYTNSIEAGYKCGVLFNNEGDGGTFDILFNKSNINWPVHSQSLKQLNFLRQKKKKTPDEIEKQKQVARDDRSKLKKYSENPKLAAKYGSDGLYMTAKQKKVLTKKINKK